MPTPEEGGTRFEFSEDEVTMVRGVATIEGNPCRIDVDLAKAEAVLTVKGEGYCPDCGGRKYAVVNVAAVSSHPLDPLEPIRTAHVPCPRCNGKGTVDGRSVTVPVAVSPQVRTWLNDSMRETLFYVGAHLRCRDTLFPETMA